MVSRESQTEQQRMQAAVPLTVVADANFAARSNCSEPPVRGAYTWETVSTVKCLYRSDLGRKLGLVLPCTARGNTPCSARIRRTGVPFELVDGCLPLTFRSKNAEPESARQRKCLGAAARARHRRPRRAVGRGCSPFASLTRAV